MPDILHDFPIAAPIARVFAAISTPEGLDTWWTKTCSGRPEVGAAYALGFGPGYDWRARVTRCVPGEVFELEMTDADADWTGSHVTITLDERDGLTWVRFRHTGWPEANEHFRISCHCWGLYLRLLQRSLEHGELVPYDERLSA